MTLRYTTPIPNRFFDKLMIDLSASAIRVYLKIARNTLGWRDKQGNVKERDWISHSQFGNIGVSSRSVTTAVDELLSYGLIHLTDEHGNSLNHPKKRKRSKRIFYSLVLNTKANSSDNKAKIDKTKAQFLRTTKDIFQNSSEQKRHLTDRERIQQLFQSEEEKQIRRDNWL